MARKQKKRSPKKAKPAESTGPVLGGARRYQFERLSKFRARGREADALAVLARLWPDRSAARLDWLLLHWPEQAAVALDAWWDADLDGAMEVLDEALLAMGTAGLAAVADGVPAPWFAEAETLLAASTALAAGDDAGAKAGIKALGRRSPIGQSQRFLRGLMAWYAKDEGRAKLVWAGLPAEGRLARAAAQVQARPDTTTLLGAVVEAVQGRLPETAMKAAAAAFEQVDASTQRLLARSMPGTLMGIGVGAEAAYRRVRVGLPGVEAIIDKTQLQALGTVNHRMDAVQSWTRVSKLEALSPLARAAVWVRMARLLREAVEDLHADGPPAWEEDRKVWEQMCEELPRVADRHIASAIEVDPHCINAWQLQLESAEGLEKGARARLLESYAAQFPDSPDALVRAAEACVLREVWDKGLRHARRAMTLLPLDRTPRDLVAQLLAGKARKRFAAQLNDEAQALYTEAVAMTHLTPRVLFALQAEFVGFLSVTEQAEAAQTLREKVLGLQPQPWRFAAAQWAGTCRLRREWVAIEAMPASTPDADELELVALLDHRGTLDDEHAALGDAMYADICRRPMAQISDVLTVRRLMRLVDDEAEYPLLVQAQRLDPDDWLWLYRRYSRALELAHPAEAFEQADTEVAELLARLRSLDDDAHEMPLDRVEGTLVVMLEKIATYRVEGPQTNQDLGE
jgi:tetratricopeptide (TPR) repeat protein